MRMRQTASSVTAMQDRVPGAGDARPPISRRRFLRLGALSTAGAVLAVGGAAGYALGIEPACLTLERVRIPVAGLAPALNGLRVVHLTDLHLHPGQEPRLIRRAAALTNRLAPDVIVLTGDYTSESADPLERLAPELAALRAPLGAFACLGNHDLWYDAERARRVLEQIGIRVLVNGGVALEVGGAALYLAGLDDGWSGAPDLAAALDGCPSDAPVLLLAHEPDLAPRWAADARVALQLAGHSHGGQVRLPGVGAPMLPYLAQRYDMGLYRVGAMWLYVSRGVGTTGLPVRLGCPPEVTELTLVR
ncbi:MAG: metallophosphoesterase, partial [Chloroflexota bacterium]